ncbi:unnamed protein product [Ixodes hexagonus]
MQALCEPQENVDTRGAAQCLLVTVCNFTFLCYLYLWCAVLDEVNAAQLYLQTKGLSLDKVVAKLEALKLFLKEERDRLVRSALEQALVKSNELGIAVERRVRLKKRMAGEQVRDSGLSLQEENRRAMLECTDRFDAELQIRSKALLELTTLFGPLEAKSLLYSTEEELSVSVPKFTDFYDELSESALFVEIPRLRRHLRAAGIDFEEAKQWAALDFLKFITQWDFIVSSQPFTRPTAILYDLCVCGIV